MDRESEPYLELSEDPVRFEAVNQVTNVFFDDSNKQVFAVRSGGVLGVNVKGADESAKPINFRMEDHGPVISIKFSLDRKILAVQRTTASVEFMNFNGLSVESEYTQTCKRNAVIVGFVWTQNNEVAYITEQGIELYLVLGEKRTLKHLKSLSVPVQWFVWCPVNKIALLSSAHGSQLQPIIFKLGSVSKLPKVETELGRMALERDVTLATLYNIPAVLILRHQTSPSLAEVHVYTLNGPGQSPVKSHVLKLGLSGRFAINVVDNLILIHHQASRRSLVFDTALSGESDGNITYHNPAAPARSLKAASLTLPGLVEPQTYLCELYSPNWVVFQPNIVIDAKLGCLWRINLKLRNLVHQIPDLDVSTQLTLKRTDGKPVLLELLSEHTKLANPPLKKLQESFNHINVVYRVWVENEIQSNSAAAVNTPLINKPLPQPLIVVDQVDMQTYVFQNLDGNEELHKLEWVLIAYMTSLSENLITPQHNINELLVTTLVRQNKFTALHQMLQYGVITDSKPLACLLLSLGNMHPTASQLALDMLNRLNAIEEMQEVLLSQNQILSALKISGDNVNPRKFLDAAKNEASTLHSVFYYFNSNPQFSAMLRKDERLAEYVNTYRTLFPDAVKS